MSEVDNIVTITISRETATVSRAGFGTPAIIAYHSKWAERARSYTSLAGLVADGFATTDPVYLAASAIWSQNPKPPTIIVGRRASAPTQVETLTPTAQNSVTYTVLINTTPFEYTSDASATVQEIVEGLAAAINTSAWAGTTAYDLGDHVTNDSSKVYVCRTAGTSAGAGGPTGTSTGIVDGTCTWDYLGPVQAVTASEDDASLTLTADVAGTMFLLEESSDYDGTNVWARNDDSTDPGLSDDLNAIALYNNDWYGFCLDTHSKAELVVAATWAESNSKLHIATSADTAILTSSTSDVASTLKTSARERTAVFYHQKPHQYLGAAIMGKMLPKDPGSATWAYKNLSGPDASSLTATQISYLKAKYCNYYIALGGSNRTFGGRVAKPEWIDTIRFSDWLSTNTQADVLEALYNADKIPYDEGGIEIIAAAVKARLQLGIAAGGLKASPAPVVTTPALADISASDQNNRNLPDVEATAYLAGAIHTTAITIRVIGAVS